jgi:ATP-dependent protease ClpP protease subunit
MHIKNKAKLIIIKFFIVLILASPVHSQQHTILGTTSIYPKSSKYKIISDIVVNDLRVRHVRHTNSSMCAGKSQVDDHIEMSGPINPDTPFIIKRLLNKIKDSPNRCVSKSSGRAYSVEIFLNSGGGYMEDGYELGKLLRKAQATTTIAPYGGECYSSCAAAFLGGVYRKMGNESKLMFHAPYLTSGYDISCLKNSDKLRSYFVQMLNDEDGNFLYERTMSYCSRSSGWSLNVDAAELFGLLK